MKMYFCISSVNPPYKIDVKEIMKNPGKVPYIDKQQKIKYDPAPRAAMPKPNFVETNKILGR